MGGPKIPGRQDRLFALRALRLGARGMRPATIFRPLPAEGGGAAAEGRRNSRTQFQMATAPSRPSVALTDGAGRPTIGAMKSGPRKFELTADILLRAYSIGVFPMAESRESTELFWVEPHERGVFPLDGLVVSRSLAKTLRSDRFEVVADRDFSAVMRACADRDNTWINDEILRLYAGLHRAGHAHSIEVYENGALVGGLYGVSLRSVFFGESMFHRARDASKVALVHLFARLRAGGFRLLDTQFLTEHLASLGAIAVSREDFRLMLAESLRTEADFGALPAGRALPGGEALTLALGMEVARPTGDGGRSVA
jgi:leucyl/phenylalanyl-tRNA---protein transferase